MLSFTLVVLLCFISSITCIPKENVEDVVDQVMDHLDAKISQSTDHLANDISKTFPETSAYDVKDKAKKYLNKSLKSKILKDLRPIVEDNIEEGIKEIQSANMEDVDEHQKRKFAKSQVEKIVLNIQEQAIPVTQDHLTDFTTSHKRLYAKYLQSKKTEVMSPLNKRGLLGDDGSKKVSLGVKLLTAGIAFLIARWMLGTNVLYEAIGQCLTWIATWGFMEVLSDLIFGLFVLL